MKELPRNLRIGMIERLELFASKQQQIEYQRNVPFINVPTELFCMWDDMYLPDDRDFQAAFTAPELQVLSEFEKVFERVASAMPNSLPSLDDCQNTAEWNELSLAARNALDSLGTES